MVQLPEDFEMNREHISVLTREIRKHDKTVIDEINAAVNWYSLLKPVKENILRITAGRDLDPEVIVKSLILQEIYGLGEVPFEIEVADRKSFKKFLGLSFGDVVPGNETLEKCRVDLMRSNLYDKLFDNFFRQLLDADVIPDGDLLLKGETEEDSSDEIESVDTLDSAAEETIIEEPSMLSEAPEEMPEQKQELSIEEKPEIHAVPEQPLSVDDMIKEIEDRVKKLHDKKTPEEKQKLKEAGLKFNGDNGDTVESESPELVKKLSTIDQSLQKIYKNIEALNEKQGIVSDEVTTEETEKAEKDIEGKVADLYGMLKDIDDKIKKVTGEEEHKTAEPEVVDKSEEISANVEELREKIEEKLQESGVIELKKENGDKEDLYKKLFDSFYSQLVDADIIKEAKLKKEQEIKTAEITDSTVTPEAEVKEEVKIETKVEKKGDVKIHVEEKKSSDYVLEGRVEQETGKTIPVVMRPKQKEINLRDKKKYPIFNDANLTEDYELGLRFYKLGFKTSFVNLKTDNKYGNSRIGTGEYFPNSFWASVKQKSRWIAGIVFQNWKIHGWKGSFKTKYFLARDRKTIVSFIGTALSFIVFAYFIAFAITRALGYDVLPTIVEQNTVLWYLMLTSLLFMFVRVFHKFAFTYNWYGLRYAIMSIPRTLVDNVVNFFAMIRAIKVFRQTKDKVVWDSTEHY
jgi:hypothetical protein